MLADVVSVESRRATWLRRWWAIAGLALFAATWKLWIPQTEFPQVPLFGWAGRLPLVTDWLAFWFLLGSLAAGWRPDSRRSWIVFVVSLGVLLVLDQHRLQPWVWQLFLMSTVWMAPQPSHWQARSARLLRVLTISIYFWSAMSKLDAGFYWSHGPRLEEALLKAIGIHATHWSAIWKWRLAFVLPLGELLVAIGLCWPRTRRVALIAASALHTGLILALGPLGLGHRPGVLIWNVAFIGHDWLLFGRRMSEEITSTTAHTLSFGRRAYGWLFVTIVGLWPMTEQWRLCDRWLAWNLYSARSERVIVTLTDEGMRRLPESAQRLETEGDVESVRRLAAEGELWLDRWSLSALDAPIYPQLRFQFGVVEWLRQRCGDENLVEIIVWHSRNGSGDIERLTVEQLDEARRAFWFNTRPRGGSLADSRR